MSLNKIQNRTEAALWQSRDELQAIYDRIEDGIVIINLETGCLLRRNAAMCRMLQYSGFGGRVRGT